MPLSTTLEVALAALTLAALVGAGLYHALRKTRASRDSSALRVHGSRGTAPSVLRLHNQTAQTLHIYTEPIRETYHLPPGLTAELRNIDLEPNGALDFEVAQEPLGTGLIAYAGADVVVSVSGEPLTRVESYPFPLSDALVELPPVTPELVKAIKDSGVTKPAVRALRGAYRALIRPEEQAPRAAFLQELLDRWDA